MSEDNNENPVDAGSNSLGSRFDGGDNPTDNSNPSDNNNPLPIDIQNPPTTDPDFKIPDEYKEAKWTAKIKSNADLFKAYDSVQKFIGKKTVGVPNADSTDEEWAEFNQKMAGENPEYAFTENTPDEDKKFLTEMFKENGINKRGGDNIIQKYNEFLGNKLTQLKSKEGFNKIAIEKFGNNKTANEVYGVMEKYLDEEDNETFSSFTNEQLISVVSMVNKIKNDYGVSNDSKLNGKQGSNAGVFDPKRAETLIKEFHAKQQKGSVSKEESKRYMNEILEANGVPQNQRIG